MSRAHVLIAVGLLTNGACVVARQPPVEPASTRVATRGEAGAASEAPAAAPAGSEREPDVPHNLMEAMLACRRVHERNEPRVACSAEFIDVTLTMMLAFENAADAAKYSDALEARLSMPFCEAANRAGTSAALYVLVANTARQFDCELWQWGDWFALDADP